MVSNPLRDNPEREQRVRERAYHLWEADGKPHGRDVEYWQRARELIGMEESADAALLPNPQKHQETIAETGVEEAEIQENLGEFPDRFADQGEVQPTPTAAHARRRQAEDEPPAKTAAPAKKPAAAAPRKAAARPKKSK